MGSVVTILAPDGTAGTVPAAQAQNAINAGGKIAIHVYAPDGTAGFVPQDQLGAALKAGASYSPPASQHGGTPQPAASRGFLGSFADASGLSSIGQAIAHPIDTVTGLPGAISGELQRSGTQLKEAWNTPSNQPVKAIDRTMYAIPFIGGSLKTADEQAAAGNYAGAAGSAAGVGTALLAPEIAKGASGVARAGAGAAADTAAAARSRALGGTKLDQVIPGDTVTPRQVYNTAKDMGVNLDTAQATQAPVAVQMKRATEHSLGGSSTFAENNAANVKALQDYSQQLLDKVSPVDISREDFGNTVRQRLAQHQQSLNDDAAAIYKRLDADVGSTKPDTMAVRDVAQNIIDDNKDYYANHPEFLKGEVGSAWKIVKSLADSGEAPATKTVTSPILDASGARITQEVPVAAAAQDSWSNLHKLRTDLMNMYRSPDIVGSNAEGWLKQLTGKVDESMTGAASGLSPAALDDFREANDIYKYMKDTYDNPSSKLYHAVRTDDGLKVANNLANVTPVEVKKIAEAAPDLVPQLQRQTISRLLTPTGNDLPDLGNLAARFGRAQKEQLAGVLTPEQIKSVEDLGRVSRAVKYDSNVSGSGKVVQASNEGKAALTSLGVLAGGAAAGNPVVAAAGALPLAWLPASRLAAKALTNPEFTESIMSGRMVKPIPGESMAAYLARKNAAKP